MLNTQSPLDNLLGGVTQLTGGQRDKVLTDEAKGAWNNPLALDNGAIAGGFWGYCWPKAGGGC